VNRSGPCGAELTGAVGLVDRLSAPLQHQVTAKEVCLSVEKLAPRRQASQTFKQAHRFLGHSQCSVQRGMDVCCSFFLYLKTMKNQDQIKRLPIPRPGFKRPEKRLEAIAPSAPGSLASPIKSAGEGGSGSAPKPAELLGEALSLGRETCSTDCRLSVLRPQEG